MEPTEPEEGRPADRHLWQFPFVRDLLWLALAAFLLWLAFQTRHVLIPILIGLLLAYLVNPLITWVRRRWGISRAVSILAIFALIILAGTGAGIWLAPLVAEQTAALAEKTPGYFQSLSGRYGVQLGDVAERLSKQLQISDHGPVSVLHLIGSILGTTTNIILWVILIPLYFAFFAWHFQEMVEEGRHWLPPERHPRAAAILARMDEAVGTFFRARVLISFIVGVVFAVGWWLTAVPYWFLLGAITGAFSMVPYLSIGGWFLALLFKYLDMTIGPNAPGFDWMAVIVWPSVVFGVGNILEGWILTPWIHGRTTHLSPVMILTIVLLGGAIGGFWGLLLAIPVAICLNILGKEFLLPRLRRR